MTQTDRQTDSPPVSWTEEFYPVAHVARGQLLHLTAGLLEAGRSWLSSREGREDIKFNITDISSSDYLRPAPFFFSQKSSFFLAFLVPL